MAIASIENGALLLRTSLFSARFDGFDTAEEIAVPAGLSLPYVDIAARADDAETHFHVWEDLPLVYLPQSLPAAAVRLDGEHWTLRAVRLSAFSDDNDTLCGETVLHLFARRTFCPLTGNLFFLEDPQSGRAIVLISETPDYQETTLTVAKGEVALDNGGYPVAIGYCKRGECEALCRSYYRHARAPRELVAMSNTWGDGNGATRVCRDFILGEIDAGAALGIDIVQVDDGWQRGSTSDLSLRDERNRRFFPDFFWELSAERFPGGMREITDYAAARGLQVGLWFAPDSHDTFATLERDKAVLRRAYREWGFRFFKLDMFWVSDPAECAKMLELAREICSWGDDAAIQFDVTRNKRLNYLCGRQYGTVFVENRYTASGNSFPHRIARNLWMLSHYLPAAKFQFEIVNPDLNADRYAQDDPFRPQTFGMDYLFASVMLANPLFWMEMQFLPEARREELQRIMPVWKAHRGALARGDVCPIGETPSGRSIFGYCVKVDGKAKYLLLFREVSDRGRAVLPAQVSGGAVRILAANAPCTLSLTDGAVQAEFSAPRSYVFAEIG